jgi:TatD DNase family protein
VTTSPFIDFHCHLDLYPNHQQAVAECERQGIFTLAVTTTPRAWPRNHELSSATKYVRAALGLHPQLVKERANEISLWREYLPNSRYVGEVGLDAGPRFYASFEAQKQIFEIILRDCADRGGRILTIHSVRAARTVLDMLETYLPRVRGSAVLHWFTGTKAEAERGVRLGAYFSINHGMLRNDRHCSVVSALPLDRLLTETDGPFAKIDGRQACPADVFRTVEELARIRSIPPLELTEIIASNLKRLLAE